MNTISRINTLCHRLCLPRPRMTEFQLTTIRSGEGSVRYATITPVHDFLDKLEKHVGIRTRFSIRGGLTPVGERIRRLERHLDANVAPEYFARTAPTIWL